MSNSDMKTLAKRTMAVGFIAALSGALLWGFSGACAQVALSSYSASPLFITVVRAFIAAGLLLAFCLMRYRATLCEILACKKLRGHLLLFGVGLFLSQSTFTASVASTNAGTATVLQSLATVFVMGITCIASKRLPSKYEATGLLFALASTWLIATQGNPSSLAIAPVGLIWGIVNALSVTLYIMIPGKLYSKWPSIPVITCGLCVAALVSALTFGAECVFVGGVTIPAFDAYGLFVLVGGIGVLGTACAFGLYLYGVASVGSVRGSLLGTAEPASAMVLTACWLGTVVTVADWAGLVLMVAMVFLVALSAKKR